jgi:hypothetical protein
VPHAYTPKAEQWSVFFRAKLGAKINEADQVFAFNFRQRAALINFSAPPF